MIDRASYEDLTHRLKAAVGCERMEPSEARLGLVVIRRLAEGRPVDRDGISPSATTDGDPWESLTQLGAQFDERGRLTAFGGLSLTPTAHRFRIGERELYTWCAADTLFLPALLGVSAVVESTCPVTGSTIRVRVAPDGIEGADPAEAVVSFIVPAEGEVEDSACGPASCGSASPGSDGEVDWQKLVGVEGAFCGKVHFFRSAEAAAPWLAAHGDAVVLPLSNAYELSREAWAEPLLRLEDGGGV